MNYRLSEAALLFRKIDTVRWPYYERTGWVTRECAFCSFHGCVQTRAKYGKHLGHWIWALEYSRKALRDTLGPNALWRRLTALDYSRITDVEVDGIDLKDYPDFCDAHIVSATYKGREMTERELERLNEDKQYVYEYVTDKLY